MKLLKDLKEDILNNKINNFYVFCGEEYGIKQHYIDRISKKFNNVKSLNSASLLSTSGEQGLFKLTTLFIVYDDQEFAKNNSHTIAKYIHNLTDDGVILIYEKPLENTTLFKEFGDYITLFSKVSDNIAVEFVTDELNISSRSKKELAKNCDNDYNKILLESDKVRSYANQRNVNLQTSYDDLYKQNQLIKIQEPFNIDLFINDILTKNFNQFDYWINLIGTYYREDFWMSLTYIFNNFIIAYVIKVLGYYNAGNFLYENKFSWTRTKVIRDLDVRYSKEDLFIILNSISEMDRLVKTGKLESSNAFNYFMYTVI